MSARDDYPFMADWSEGPHNDDYRRPLMQELAPALDEIDRLRAVNGLEHATLMANNMYDVSMWCELCAGTDAGRHVVGYVEGPLSEAVATFVAHLAAEHPGVAG